MIRRIPAGILACALGCLPVLAGCPSDGSAAGDESPGSDSGRDLPREATAVDAVDPGPEAMPDEGSPDIAPDPAADPSLDGDRPGDSMEADDGETVADLADAGRDSADPVDEAPGDTAPADPGPSDDGNPGPDVPVATACPAISGLSWQSEPQASMNFAAATDYCDGLGSGWHVPTLCELRSFIAGCAETHSSGSCGVGDTCTDFCDGSCTGCQTGAGPADGCYWAPGTGGACGFYWTSTPHGSWGGYVWAISFDTGTVFNTKTSSSMNVRCVH